MINYIWYFLILIGSSYLLFTDINLLNDVIISGANKGIELLINIIPMLLIWTGILKILEKSNLLNKITILIKPLLKKIFPSVKNDLALNYITSNIVANSIGLGSTATPFGLKAMQELQKDNIKKDTATEGMITFLILNTSGLTLIPTTVIGLRQSIGSINPSEIIITSIIATTIASSCGLIIDYFIRRKK